MCVKVHWEQQDSRVERLRGKQLCQLTLAVQSAGNSYLLPIGAWGDTAVSERQYWLELNYTVALNAFQYSVGSVYRRRSSQTNNHSHSKKQPV